MTQNFVTASSRVVRTLVPLMTALAAGPAWAQLIDLNVNDPNVPACVAGATNSEHFENTLAINEQILALTNPSGTNVFWELGFSDPASSVSCTPAPATGFATSYTCANGLSIALPSGATETTSVASTQPVVVSAPSMSGIGTATFSLTATLDAGSFPSCQNFYEVEVLEPKQAFDLAFVLDRSGSMGIAASGGTRWDALRTGVEAFLPFIEVAARSPTPSGSRFGLTFFDTTVNTASTQMFNILTGAGTQTPEFLGVSSLLSQTPSGATAMGQGLQDAMGKTTDPSRPRVVVLFSDGEQNVNPRVATGGCSFINPASDINPPPCPATEGHKIITTGIGSPSGSYLTTLQNLGANNRGTNLITDNGSDFTGDGAVPGDIGGTFQASIGEALQDNSPQQIAFFAGPMLPDPNAPGPVVLPAFDVNRKVDRLLLSLTLSSRFERPQVAQIIGGINVMRDGTDVTQQFEPMIFGNFTDVVTLVAESTGSEGEETPLEGSYVVSLTLPQGFKPDLEYRLVPYADDRRLEIDSSLGAVARVNEAIEVSVQLSWLNQPIEDASVVVRAFGPGADMGEVLSRGEPIAAEPDEDTTNAGIQKYNQLAANDPEFLEQLKLSPNAITMAHEGDGRYTGSYQIPDNVGVVHFVYDVAANDQLYGSIQRHWYESAYARFDAIDMEASNMASAISDGSLVLTFTPVRPSGKLLGPGHLSAFAFEGATLQDARDLQTGAYEFTLEGDDAETPITVTLLGDEIYAGPAGWGDGPDRSFVDWLLLLWPWLLILVVVLLALLIIFFIFRARTSSP